MPWCSGAKFKSRLQALVPADWKKSQRVTGTVDRPPSDNPPLREAVIARMVLVTRSHLRFIKAALSVCRESRVKQVTHASSEDPSEGKVKYVVQVTKYLLGYRCYGEVFLRRRLAVRRLLEA